MHFQSCPSDNLRIADQPPGTFNECIIPKSTVRARSELSGLVMRTILERQTT